VPESAIDFSVPSLRTFSTSPCGGLSSRHLLELRGDVVERSTPKARHMRRSSELVDQERQPRALHVLEQERGAAGLDDAVGDLRDLEVGIDLGRDADELALALEQGDPLAEVGDGLPMARGARLLERPLSFARRRLTPR
jgi:hypothetical protein